MQLVEYLRKKKGILIVGDNCTGKSILLKILQRALHVAFNVNLKMSIINTEALSKKELFGTENLNNKTDNKDS